MLNLNQIRAEFPAGLQTNPRNFLREYLQYKLLESLFAERVAAKLTFIGGTAIRMVHNSQRFSEDLDFDLIGLKVGEFEKLAQKVERDMNRLGLNTSVRITFSDAYHAYVRFSEILYDLALSPLPEEKLHIRIDTYNQGIRYEPTVYTLDKFDVYQNIWVAPGDILLAMKVATILSRKRPQGRDYFDASFLLSRGFSPNLEFLQHALGFQNRAELGPILQQHLDAIDLEELAHDVSPFLFNPNESQRITDFRHTIDKFF